MVELHRMDELKRIAQDGAVMVLKIDGERKDDPDIFTVVLSGGKLRPDDFFRMDGGSLSGLIDRALKFYEERGRE
jgi:hypothetical protein